ncbi:MAG: DNA repair protein RecO [Actinomycetaceae bacterium]|nr:DNA repair protein RecO [Actinomycetaceae bacterium]
MSKLYRDEAIVLRTHKLGEADRIITFLTRDHGQVRAVAKGVRRTSSRFGARLEPFGVVDLQLHRGRNLDIVTQVETLAPYGRSISPDYPRYTAACLMVETLEKLTADDPQSSQQYLLTLGALHALAHGTHHPTLVLDSYLLRLLALAGWAPSFYDCAQCGASGPHTHFTIQGGGAVCETCRPAGSFGIAPEVMQLLGALLSGEWEVADAADESARDSAQGIVSAYTQWHVERRLRSLPLLELA